MKHSLSRFAAIVVGCLLISTDASATHFRFGNITWKQSPTNALTVEITVTEAWRHSGLGIGELFYSFGDGTFFDTSSATNVAVLTDIAGEEYSIWRYTTTHTYPSFGQYIISGESCCRISSLVNAGDASEKLTAIVDLVESNTGSPVATVPVILQMVANRTNSLQLAIADPDGDPFTVRMATSEESFIPSVATIGSNVLAVSSSGLLTWDTTGAVEGQKFAVQVVIEEHHPDTGFEVSGQTVLDFIIEIVGTSANQPPTCTGDSGPFVIPVGQTFTTSFTGTDPDGSTLRINHQGLPSGATISPVDGTTGNSPMTVTFSWTPTQSDANTSHAVLLTFTDAGGLQAVCSFAITVTTRPSIFINDPTVKEGDSGTTNMLFELTLSAPSTQPVSVNFTTANDSASAGSDYVSTNGVVTFSPGQTNQVVCVRVNGDTTYEINETFFVNLSSPVNAFLGDNRGVGTILDDDPAPEVNILPVITSVSDPAVTEGNSGTTNAVFTVMLSCPSLQVVTVRYAAGNGTAVAGTDFVSASGVLTFPPGEIERTVTVAVNGDQLDEPNEAFFLNLSNPTNAIIGDAAGMATITDDDPATVTLSINDVSVMESNSGTAAATFTVTLSQASGQAVTVQFATGNVTASAGSDYVAKTGTLNIPAGSTTATVAVTITSDTEVESDETFVVRLSNPVNATIADSEGTGTILDNPAPGLMINNVAVTEGNEGITNALFEVTLTRSSQQTVTVQYSTANGTATTAGSDYSLTSGTLTFPPGETVRTIEVPVMGDLLHEGDETFVLNLTNPTNAILMDNQGTGTIMNDDSITVDLSIYGVTVQEPGSGTANAVFSVLLSGPSGQTVSVNYSTSDGTAMSGSDYSAQANSVITFPPGTTNRTLSIVVNGDAVTESDETFTVTLSNAVNATIATNQAVGTIVDTAPVASLPKIDLPYLQVVEGTGGTTNLVFPVTLSVPSAQTVTVNYTTVDGPAVAGSDYVATSGTLTFLPGSTNQPITVVIIGDTMRESTEGFYVMLSNPTNATLVRNSVSGTINDDDPPPQITIHNASHVEGHAGSSLMEFNLFLSEPTTQPVTINFITVDGSATAPGAYTARSGTLIFPAGTTQQCVAVTIFGNTVIENDKTLLVRLSAPVNATLANQEATGTIVNDDGLPGDLDHFEISDIHTPQYVNQPFAVIISAKDRFGGMVSNYNGSVQITGTSQVLGGAHNFLGGIGHQASQTANLTVGYAFAPNTDLVVTHVRHYSGTKVSIWTDNGTSISSTMVSGTAGTWQETKLSAPVTLLAGVVYRLTFVTSGTYYYRSGGAGTFAHGVLGQAYFGLGDTFPTAALPFRPLVDLRYSVLGGAQAVDFTPMSATPFGGGLWVGLLTMLETADLVTLQVNDGIGHTGQSTSFAVLASSDPFKLTTDLIPGDPIKLFYTPGEGYIIESSTDLIHWTPVFTNLTGSASSYFSESIGNSTRFYRAQPLP
ncbi:MAG: Calx-beta domain-containing protein [Verrucomicrobiota bacterium]